MLRITRTRSATRVVFATFSTKKQLLINTAITREISDTLKTDALCLENSTKLSLDLSLAKQQHDELNSVLKSLGLSVVSLPSDGFADSVFIEDTAICVGDKTLITNPGAVSRRGETARVKDFFQNDAVVSKGRQLQVMTDGTLDGGDVMFTGIELFVGLTERTNLAGIASLATAFPQYPVVTVDMHGLQKGVEARDRVLHLKSCCSMCGDGHILVGGIVGARFRRWLEATGRAAVNTEGSSSSSGNGDAKASSAFQYRVTEVPDAAAANCLLVNGTVVRRASSEFPASGRVFESLLMRDTPQVEVRCSELAKVDGAVTCCSLLLNVPPR